MSVQEWVSLMVTQQAAWLSDCKVSRKCVRCSPAELHYECSMVARVTGQVLGAVG